MKNKLIIITPVDHIEKFLKKANNFFQVSYHPEINQNRLKNKIKNQKYIFTNPNMSKIFLDKNIIENSNIKAICTASTGTNHIDLDYIKKNKIKLLSLTKEYSLIKKLSSTSELAFGLTLNALRNISTSSRSVKHGKWSYLPYVGRMMKSLKICSIGYGRLGKIYIKYCLDFGSEVFVYDPFKTIKKKNIKQINKLSKNLNSFDIISINIHASKENVNFFNKDILKYLKNNVIIINTSRGEVVNEIDLIQFLKKNKNAKYYTDVVSNEQTGLHKNKIIKEFKKDSKQILVTPHIGGMTLDGQKLAYNHALDMLIKFDKKFVKTKKKK